MKQIAGRVAAFIIGLGLGVAALAGLETVTHIQDLNAAWPLGSDLASTSDDHIRNIKTALKNDFPNMNGTYSSASAPPFAAPNDTNTGIYFPSADDLAIATGGTKRFEIGSAGNVTISAPTSGIALAVVGVASATTGGIQLSGSPYYQGDVGKPNYVLNSSGSNFGLLQNDAADTWSIAYGSVLNAAGTSVFQWKASGPQLLGRGPVAGAMVDMTPDTGTFTGTFTGFSAGVTGAVTWTRIGKLVLLNFPSGASGTSNATTFTMTGLPSAVQPATLTQAIVLPSSVVLNNSGQGTNVDAIVTAGSGTITFRNSASSTAWTNSGTKGFVSNSVTMAYLLN